MLNHIFSGVGLNKLNAVQIFTIICVLRDKQLYTFLHHKRYCSLQQ